MPALIGQLFSQTDSCVLERNYFSSRKIQSEGCIIHGKREGKWNEFVEYDDKYYLRFTWTFKNGLKDGPYQAYFENGNVETVGQWREGRLIDTVKTFTINGELAVIDVWVPDVEPGSSYTVYHKQFINNTKSDKKIEVTGAEQHNVQPKRHSATRKKKKKR